ncbi:MAG: T9SS type A sorting domain-containing protein [Flavobacteriales bacterium]
MKKLMILLLCAAAVPAHAQIQNGGFEQLNVDVLPVYWQGIPFIQLVWIDSNGVAHADSVVFDEGLYVLNTADVHSGSNAAELRNAYNYTMSTTITGNWIASLDTFTYGFPQAFLGTAMRPGGLSFYGKYLPAGTDSAYAEVRVYDEALNEIGAGTLAIGNTVSVYTLFDVPINYLAQDSAAYVTIHFSTASPGSAATFGTRFLIDDVSMSYMATAVADIAGPSENAPYPNPATDMVALKGIDASGQGVRLFDACGRQVAFRSVTNADRITISTAGLPRGLYALHVEGATGNVVYRIVLE